MKTQDGGAQHGAAQGGRSDVSVGAARPAARSGQPGGDAGGERRGGGGRDAGDVIDAEVVEEEKK